MGKAGYSLTYLPTTATHPTPPHTAPAHPPHTTPPHTAHRTPYPSRGALANPLALVLASLTFADQLTLSATVKAIYRVGGFTDAVSASADLGQVGVVLDRTNFYAEQGTTRHTRIARLPPVALSTPTSVCSMVRVCRRSDVRRRHDRDRGQGGARCRERAGLRRLRLPRRLPQARRPQGRRHRRMRLRRGACTRPKKATLAPVFGIMS